MACFDRDSISPLTKVLQENSAKLNLNLGVFVSFRRAYHFISTFYEQLTSQYDNPLQV